MRDTVAVMKALGCAVIFLVACGGGSDTPVEKCDDLVDLVCDRAVDCVPTAGTHAECVTEVEASGFDCGAATDVSPSYGACMMQLRSTTCGSLFPNDMLSLPADCSGVILIE